MKAMVALLFPIAASVLSSALAVWQRQHPSLPVTTRRKRALRAGLTVLVGNIFGSLAFGAFIATVARGRAADDPLWFLPLVFAPIEYWARFGLPILIAAALVAAFAARRE